MTRHLPINCAYIEEADEVVKDSERWTTVDCEVCIAVVTAHPSDPDKGDDGRAVWHEAVMARLRVRQALYACGFEKAGETERTFGKGLLCDYAEEFTGPLGLVLIDWTTDPEPVVIEEVPA